MVKGMIKNRNSKGQMNISFGLIFAIIAGAFILALAIFAVTKFVKLEQKSNEGEIGKTIGILTNPLESSFESSRTVTITAPVETRIYTGCYFNKIEYEYREIGPIPEVIPTRFEGNGGEVLLVDDIYVYNEGNSDETGHGFKFWKQDHLSRLPQDWSAYETGQIEMRFEVIAQSTGTQSNLQFGIWQNGIDGSCKRETMSDTVTMSGPGDVQYSTQDPSSWWEAPDTKPDVTEYVDWSDVGSFCHVGTPLWTAEPSRQLVSDSDPGNPQFNWDAREDYFPMVVRVSVVGVPENVEFSGWSNWINPTDTSLFRGVDAFQADKYFGKQLLNTTQLSYGKWTDTTMNVGFSNKYIFSENPSQGKKFYVFSKPFEFPYKVSDLIYVLSADKTYCFKGTNNDLEDTIANLNQPSLLVEDEGECHDDSVNVCIGGGNDCDIRVRSGIGEVEKENGDRLIFYGDALMFAAIFSDKETYDCQVARLMRRAEALSDIYESKYDSMIDNLGCSSHMRGELMAFNNFLRRYNPETPGMISAIGETAESLENENEWSDCPLW